MTERETTTKVIAIGKTTTVCLAKICKLFIDSQLTLKGYLYLKGGETGRLFQLPGITKQGREEGQDSEQTIKLCGIKRIQQVSSLSNAYKCIH